MRSVFFRRLLTPLSCIFACCSLSPARVLAAEPCEVPPGVDAGEVVVGGNRARRIENHGSGMGRWAPWEHDRFLVFATPTCRVVGLRVAGGAGSVFASAFFLAKTGVSGVSVEEKEELLRWAGQGATPTPDILWDVPQLPFGAGAPHDDDDDDGEEKEEEGTDDKGHGGTARLRCAASPAVSLPRAWVPFGPLPTTWRQEACALEEESVARPFAASPPCFRVLFGERFGERPARSLASDPTHAGVVLPKGRRLVDFMTEARNVTHLLGIVDDRKKQVQWLGMNYGPVQVLGTAAGRIVLQTWASPLDDGPPNLVVIDPRASTAQACRLDLGIEGLFRLEGTSRGLAIHNLHERDPDSSGDSSAYSSAESFGGSSPHSSARPALTPRPRIIAYTDVLAELARANVRPPIQWRSLQEGLSYAALRIVEEPRYGDGLLHVVRIDPQRAPVWGYASSLDGEAPRTAAVWAEQKGLAVVINAGMYEEDHQTHTGYFRVGSHINSSAWRSAYKSALVVSRGGPPAARILDLDAAQSAGLAQPTQPAESGFTAFDLVSQNLRLIKAPGINVWAENHRAWSEAAVAMTKTGELLFLFSRSPLSMRAFNAKLLAAGLDIVQAMHVEGGPEASLSIHVGGVDLDVSGSYETGFVESDDNRRQWPLPNVLGVPRTGP